MSELQINEWDVLNPAIDSNRQPRINWREVFGISLSKKVADYYHKGVKWDFCYADLCDIAIAQGLDDYESLKRLKISVCSMYAKKKT